MKLRWKELLLAVLMAAGLWYIVAGSEKLESVVSVRVIYKGTPPGLVVLNGMVDKLEVRVRATPGILRTVTGREIPFAMDLAGLKPGENILPVEAGRLPFLDDVEVMDVNPPRIQLEVDTMASKTVPVAVDIQGDTAKGLVLQADVEPPQVELRGPSTRLAEVKTVRVPLNAEAETTLGLRTEKRSPVLPDGVESIPPQVDMTVEVDYSRKQVKVTRPVRVEETEGLGVFLRPAKVTISVALPESRVAQAATDPEIRAWVEPTSRAPGSYTLPVRVSVPDGAQLVKVEPEETVLTLEQAGPALR